MKPSAKALPPSHALTGAGSAGSAQNRSDGGPEKRNSDSPGESMSESGSRASFEADEFPPLPNGGGARSGSKSALSGVNPGAGTDTGPVLLLLLLQEMA